jgi:hypothetical protein
MYLSSVGEAVFYLENFDESGIQSVIKLFTGPDLHLLGLCPHRIGKRECPKMWL